MQSLPTCTRPCLIPKLIPNKDRECDVIYSCSIKCTDQCDWLHVPFDLYKRANISKDDHSLLTVFHLPNKSKPVTLLLSKKNKSSKLHSLHSSGKLFSLTKKITTKIHKSKFLSFCFIIVFVTINSQSSD